MLKDYYTILDLKPDASASEIKQAFRVKAKLFHPDVNHSPEAHFQFIQMKEAFDVLLKIKSIETFQNQRHYGHFHPHDPYFSSSRHTGSYHYSAHMHHNSNSKPESEDFLHKKSGRAIYLFMHVLFFVMGLLIISGPLYTVISKGFDPYRSIFDSVFFMVISVSFGVVMVYKIALSFIQFIKQGT